MLYGVGDAVIIRGDLVAHRLYKMIDGGNIGGGISVAQAMINLGGKTAVITGFTPRGNYKIDCDNGKWAWTDEMFVGLAYDDFEKSDMPIEALLT